MTEDKDLQSQALKAAKNIQEGKFQDPHIVVEEVTNHIISDLNSGDERKIKRAHEKIEDLQHSWCNPTQPSGTAGAILTRLQALGLEIELVPDEFREIQEKQE